MGRKAREGTGGRASPGRPAGGPPASTPSTTALPMVRRVTTRLKVDLAFAVALLLLGTAAALSYLSVRELRTTQNWVAHTQQVIREIEAVASDPEGRRAAAQRGFLLTGRESFLPPRRRGARLGGGGAADAPPPGGRQTPPVPDASAGAARADDRPEARHPRGDDRARTPRRGRARGRRRPRGRGAGGDGTRSARSRGG